MSLPPPDNLATEIAELKRRLAALERHGQLGSSSFQAPGKVRYRDAQGRERIRIGEGGSDGNINLVYNEGGAPDGTVAVGVVYDAATGDVIGHGLLVQDPNTSTDLLQAWRGGTGGWTFRVRDPNGNPLIHIDENGMAFPRPSQMFIEGYQGPAAVLADGVKTVSEGYVRGTYTEGTIDVRYILSGTVTARYRVVDHASGTQLVGWQTFTTSGYGKHDFTIDRALWTTPGIRRLVRVECEVTSGAGTATIHTVACYVGDFS